MAVLMFLATMLVFTGGVVAATTAYRHHRFLQAFGQLQASEFDSSRKVSMEIMQRNFLTLLGARPGQLRWFWIAIVLILAGNAVLLGVSGYTALRPAGVV